MKRTYGVTQPLHIKPRLHFFRLFLFFLIVIVVIFIFFVFLVICGLLRIVLLLFLCFFDLAHVLPLFGKDVGLGRIVSNDDIVKNGTTFDLPQVKPQETKIVELVNTVIVFVFGIRDLLGLPNAFVGWVGNSFAVPITFIRWIVLHWGFPLAVLFVVPIIRFFGIAVNDTLLLHPIIWLFVFGIINHGLVSPVIWLFISGVRDFFWFQHLPIVFDRTFVPM